MQAEAGVQPPKRRRRPPVVPARQRHGRRHEQEPHEGGVEGDGQEQAEAELAEFFKALQDPEVMDIPQIIITVTGRKN